MKLEGSGTVVTESIVTVPDVRNIGKPNIIKCVPAEGGVRDETVNSRAYDPCSEPTTPWVSSAREVSVGPGRPRP